MAKTKATANDLRAMAKASKYRKARDEAMSVTDLTAEQINLAALALPLTAKKRLAADVANAIKAHNGRA